MDNWLGVSEFVNPLYMKVIMMVVLWVLSACCLKLIGFGPPSVPNSEKSFVCTIFGIPVAFLMVGIGMFVMKHPWIITMMTVVFLSVFGCFYVVSKVKVYGEDTGKVPQETE